MNYEETIKTELKEFYINCDKESNKLPYEEYILSGKMYSNGQVLNSLKSDFIKYIPKYLSSWNHDDLEIDYGNLYFGIKDNGNIVGIPFDGILTKKIVKNLLKKTKKYIKNKLDQKILEKIKINIIEVNPPNNNLMDKYNELLDKLNESIKDHREDILKYQLWHKENRKWRCKLIDYLNNKEKRNEFLEWIKIYCTSNKENIIKKIKEWKYQEDFKERISILKYNKNHIIHWLCIFKDIKKEITSKKPIVRQIKKINWKSLYFSPCYMNYHINQINSSVRFYLIKLEIPNFSKPIYVKYKGNWIQYYRTINDLGPSSIPIL